MKVVNLNAPGTTWDAEVQAETVRMLEEWLEAARKGVYVGVAIAGVQKDGSFETETVKHSGHPALIGTVASLAHRLISS